MSNEQHIDWVLNSLSSCSYVEDKDCILDVCNGLDRCYCWPHYLLPTVIGRWVLFLSAWKLHPRLVLSIVHLLLICNFVSKTKCRRENCFWVNCKPWCGMRGSINLSIGTPWLFLDLLTLGGSVDEFEQPLVVVFVKEREISFFFFYIFHPEIEF